MNPKPTPGPDAKISAFGLKGLQPIALVLSIIAGLAISFQVRQVFPVPWNIVVALIPPTITLTYILALKHRKPAKYDSEAIGHLWFRIREFTANQFGRPSPELIARSKGSDTHPKAFNRSLEHCHVLDRHLVHLQPGSQRLRLAQGFRVITDSSLETASVRELETQEHLIRSLVRAIAPEVECQVVRLSDKDAYLPHLLAFKATTDAAEGNEWAREQRNHTFVAHLQAHEERRLRHATTAFFVTSNAKVSSEEPDMLAKVLCAHAPAFDSIYQQLRMVAHGLGGTIEKLDDLELLRLSHHYFNGQPVYSSCN